MDRTYWHRQTADKPLYPDILWSRPENQRTAGKLLIIGGNAQGFATPAEAYNVATAAGAGTVRVLMPDSLQKTVKAFLPEADYAPSTPSGSFAKSALAELLAASEWADAVLLAGELGRNSETAVLLENFAKKYTGKLCVTKDAVDYFKETSLDIISRPETMVVLSLAQLQRVFINARVITPITHGMDLLHLVDALHQITTSQPAVLVTRHLQQIFVAQGGQVSTTGIAEDDKVWRLKTAARASVFWLQTPAKQFEAVTTAVSQAQ